MGYIFEALAKADDDDRPKSGMAEAVFKSSSLEAGKVLSGPDTLTAGSSDSSAIAPINVQRMIDLDPAHMKMLDDRLVAILWPGSPVAEEYRSIRSSLLARWQHARQLVHTITSATPAEGKTITSLNLGLSFAELRNRRTVVVEADLRLPTFANLLGLKGDAEPGLVGYLQEEAELEDIVIQLGEDGLYVIPAGGHANEQAVQLLSNKRMADLLDRLRDRFDHIIIDTPPVLEFSDAGILGAISDEVLLVARMGWAGRSSIKEAVDNLASYNAQVAGIVATDQHKRRSQHYSRYGYRYDYYQKKRR